MRPPDQFASAPAEACPFVALDDDRDRRAGGPDPRHRCFAVPVPEPRALAHQQAYCLTPNFPSCPFFVGWAARAAAAPVKAPPGPSGYPTMAQAPAGFPAVPSQRPEPAPLPPDVGARAWSGQAPAWVPDAAGQQVAPPPAPPAAPTPAGTGQSWQGAGWNDDGDIFAPPPGAPPTSPPSSFPPPLPPPSTPSTVAPAAASSIERSPSPSSPAPIASVSAASIPAVAAANRSMPPSAPPSYGASPSYSASSSYGADVPSTYGSGAPVSTGGGGAAAPLAAAALPAYAAATPAPASRQAARKPTAPVPAEGEWSQGRRSQAYPSLGSRMRFKGVSPLLIGAFALAVAALVLFLLPGFLSNHGGGGGGARHETPTAIAEASVTEPPPTVAPSPTPKSYTVKSGDILSKIAQRFNVTVENLGCYNSLTNLNALQIGQVLLIPPAEYACPVTTPTKKP